MSASDFNEIFSSRLRYYLSLNKMTQLELSQKLNVGTTSVSNWCKGLKTPRMDKVDAMCRLFGCRRRDLMELPEESSNNLDASTISLDLSKDESILLKNYQSLNDTGKQEARKRVQELTEIERYKKGNICIQCGDGWLMYRDSTLRNE